MMCGIDQAIEHIKTDCVGMQWANLVINRLEYHRKQAEGVKPKRNKGMYISDYYTCANCGRRIDINDNYCAGCGYCIRWNTCRCLTGLPLVDAAEEMRGADD